MTADREELRRLLEQLAGQPVADADLDRLPEFLADFGVASEAELIDGMRLTADLIANPQPDLVGDAFDVQIPRLGDDRWLDPGVLAAASREA